MNDKDLVRTLLRGAEPVGAEHWRSWWDRLAAGRVGHGEAVAVLASLTTAWPQAGTLVGFVESLRRPVTLPDSVAGAVNIVGTGGGPATFNISTAAAVVAAAMGVPVVKTGSRAYASRHGSFDLLTCLGIPLTDSHQRTADALAEFGIACAGYFVYPPEIALLAKAIQPMDMRVLGRFVNLVGPFLPAMPVAGQLTGVADHTHLAGLRRLAEHRAGTVTWLCGNSLGADELISFTTNTIHTPDGPLTVGGPEWTPAELADLRPVSGTAALVAHFESVVAGTAPAPLVETVALNAAALALLGGLHGTWPAAVDAALGAMRDAAAIDLLHRMRTGRRVSGRA